MEAAGSIRRINLVKMRTEVENSVHALLDKYGLKYATFFSDKGVEWPKNLGLLMMLF